MGVKGAGIMFENLSEDHVDVHDPLIPALGLGGQDLVFWAWVWVLWFRIWGLGFGVLVVRFGVWGSGLRVWISVFGD